MPTTLVVVMLVAACCATIPITDADQDETTGVSAKSEDVYYQPALIGFRCETLREFTIGGISVVEANTQVTLTLFGESFTTDTIVAFTPEFHPDTQLDPEKSTHEVDISKGAQQLRELPATTATTTATTAPQTISKVTSTNQSLALAKGLVASSSQAASSRKFAGRRRTKSKSYDCTDYNRVTSYRLTKENILTPNVATLTVVLPELEPGSRMHYYFCLKQPRLTSASIVSLNPETNADESYVWVHQGDEWWVTIKVEPPILTVTNDCFLIVILLILSAVASGLNLGLMSLDVNELAVISSCGDQRERSYARIIAPLRKRGNYLLCSLLLSNVAVNSTLTVILEDLTSGLIAVIGSTLAIVILGEIVPQSLCARHGLAIGAKTIYVTYAFMILTFPLSYPISYLLDHFLGEEKGNVYDRERLMEFIKITGHHTQLDSDEVAIISGALKLKKIKVDQIMTRIEDVFMLPIDCVLNRETIKRIIEKGYSRIPVYEFGDRKQIVALILAKDLALLDPDDHTPIADMLMYCKHPLIFIEDTATLDVALNEFKTGKSHIAVVRQIYDDGEIDKYYEAIGVVTLEDVIEEVLQAEINDETDTLSDNRRKRRRTEAQVAHLLDEFTAGSRDSTPKLAADQSKAYEPASLSKQVQTSLSTQLTSVSIGGVAHSLSQSGNNYTNGQYTVCSPPSQSSRSSSPINLRDQNTFECQIGSAAETSQAHGVGVETAASEQGMLSRAAQYLGTIMR